MTLKQLKSCIDQAYKKAGEKIAATSEVEVWLGDEMLRLKSVGQFGIVPDVTLTVERINPSKRTK